MAFNESKGQKFKTGGNITHQFIANMAVGTTNIVPKIYIIIFILLLELYEIVTGPSLFLFPPPIPPPRPPEKRVPPFRPRGPRLPPPGGFRSRGFSLLFSADAFCDSCFNLGDSAPAIVRSNVSSSNY